MYTLPYGQGSVQLTLPHAAADSIVYQRPVLSSPPCMDHVLDHPIDSLRIQEAAKGCQSAVILISDSTRLCPSHLFLGSVIHRLNLAGIPDQQIRIIVALGIHRKQSEDELIQLVGPEIYRRVTVMNHSSLSEDCILLGHTSLGTPVEINKSVVAAEFRIATGNIEPHALVGISGGAKALFPGTASARAIEHNHSLSQRYTAALGDPNNAIRADLEEVLQLVPIHFMLNVIVDHERQLLGAVAGDIIAAHRAGLELVRQIFFVNVPQRYDWVIVSPGGHPKDAQLYQSVKALKNAAAITKPGGSIVLVARCEEHYGNGTLQTWIETIQDRAVMTQKLKQTFVLGAHKVEHIDHVLKQHDVYMYSEMPPAAVQLIGMHPIAKLDAFLAEHLADSSLEIAIMPYGGMTFPQVKPPHAQKLL
ncbi:nickel-dependent lactate racemase [Paenibacillus aestuarii]|uniref:Nickel-dependent lactate racemase n=1 Tax=Paenibacillus aestuarii TaxID=516965 RepID=A0ABW0KCB9_9BACL|nr:nickel-dependent lactate racemase [Paenibacillus aestuarii]